MAEGRNVLLKSCGWSKPVMAPGKSPVKTGLKMSDQFDLEKHSARASPAQRMTTGNTTQIMNSWRDGFGIRWHTHSTGMREMSKRS